MKLLSRSLMLACSLAAPLVVGTASPALAADTSGVTTTISAPMGLLTCTTTYAANVQANPNKPVPTYGILFVNATGTYNYTLYDAGQTVGYGLCVLI